MSLRHASRRVAQVPRSSSTVSGCPAVCLYSIRVSASCSECHMISQTYAQLKHLGIYCVSCPRVARGKVITRPSGNSDSAGDMVVAAGAGRLACSQLPSPMFSGVLILLPSLCVADVSIPASSSTLLSAL
ncbi:hypothetical protein L227DRAFT_259330 [Lentinus tigrinus ALCF2SS1-6]|uniref:Uncharacterized protein n=1 Tax=Lentinus tigrinus ALCF2SS1-6 TaxID=1328759 RepID=A0A5C2RZE6_9APHY|nr:hypothetical protein L227DRAFT_259330 [Lentinus tigrinus ALCF2SS1-6]